MNSRNLTVRLPDDFHAELDRLVEENGAKRSTVVKACLLAMFRRKSIPKQLLIDAESPIGNPEWTEGSEQASAAGKVGGKLAGNGRKRSE